jgi:hypothetical protein
MAACLLYAKRERLYQVEALTLMMTSEQWLPLDHAYEKDVIDKLVAEQRSFMKPLRYEATHAGRFPNFQLLDAGAQPIALDVLSAFSTRQERTEKERAIGDRRPKGWVWDTAQSAFVPDLPPKGGGHPTKQGALGERG